MTWQVVRVDTGTWAQTPVASFTSRTLADTYATAANGLTRRSWRTYHVWETECVTSDAAGTSSASTTEAASPSSPATAPPSPRPSTPPCATPPPSSSVSAPPPPTTTTSAKTPTADPSPYARVVAVVRQDNADNPHRLARVDTITASQPDATARVRAILDVSADAGHPLPNLSATQTVGLVPLPADVLTLISDLTDPSPCWFDHHGGCQAHSWLEGEPGECPHARARRLLAAARTEGATP